MSSPDIKIRYAKSGDNIQLAEFGARTFSESFGADNAPEDMAAYLAESFSPEIQAVELADPSSVFLIAEIDGVLVGYARLKEGDAPVNVSGGRPVELVRIYAGVEWIGRGVGKALMEACLAEAVRRGCDLIWLGVWDRNPRAQAFYRKWGFVEAGSHPFKLGSDMQVDMVMVRVIS
jgi:ribosomal protein S18 acetylase RimI-like enzyme